MLNNQNPFARLSTVSVFWPCCFSLPLPHHAALLRKPSPSSLSLCLFCHIHNLFYALMIGSVVNPMKSCTSGQFTPGGIYCFRLDGFHGFFHNSDGSIFSGVIQIFTMFYWGSLHTISNPFYRIRVMSLKCYCPHPLDLEAELEMLCLGASRPL